MEENTTNKNIPNGIQNIHVKNNSGKEKTQMNMATNAIQKTSMLLF